MFRMFNKPGFRLWVAKVRSAFAGPTILAALIQESPAGKVFKHDNEYFQQKRFVFTVIIRIFAHINKNRKRNSRCAFFNQFNNMKKILYLFFPLALFAACQESMEDRAEREAREYTQRMCPTPEYNNTRTDSVTFNKSTKTYTYHCLFFRQLDDTAAINRTRDQIHSLMLKELTEATNIKAYKDAGFNFEYICRSASNPHLILYRDLFRSEDINVGAKK
jgi:hypothetical protein